MTKQRKTEKKKAAHLEGVPRKSSEKILLGAKITAKTNLSKIIDINPNAGEILFEAGMHCIGCAMAGDESLEEGCMAHGMTKKQIGELLKKLNK